MARLSLLLCALGMAGGLALPAGAQPDPGSALPVGTVAAERRAIDRALDFVGRIEAIGRVEVRARVTGFLEAVQFKEGEPVREGAELYRIEPDLFEAAVKQAEGARERSRAAQTLAEIQLHRAQELLDRNSGTVVARDQARAALDQAKGAVTGDEANLQTARINLGYTRILAPIAGRIGRTSVTKGNVVGPDSGVLTSIVSQDPMYVTFPVSQREFLRYQQGADRPDRDKVGVRIRFQDGSDYGQVGRVDFVNISVDRATDTVVVRAVMPNPAGALRDGQLVHVALQVGTPEQKVLVPQAALIADQGGVYVFIVEDGRAAMRRVKTGAGGTGPDVVVEEGLSGGELVIVDGLQRVRPGIPVRASPISPSASRT
ncbi:efflux RND transporter periplasmic adaptor subunit [Methylobacterium oxalidis]|uniref:RND transporter MFP subunit n=1 Tax=Methylobacterium oxalidis TaxID=944322 RepID=A0A512J308_9HYPH|nr:efflux RND transporter periplasmic adaptor subunit [Methylobacterium oxalidis]GEP04357.1 RND transporter MFP subunit [Methylobacterium oxalidis]GJE30574.1 Efflux pump periplasmic linker BepF [Methylobacterium oxalidis]GLS67124.1 RND transporter MFP subunit [Methylobacterium oxalidis]